MFSYEYIQVLHKDIDELLEELTQLKKANLKLKSSLVLEKNKNKLLQKENQQLKNIS